ncbi:lysophospholipid acyltransferase family protein [Zhouia spongiae]|uniref:Lysophospholipid acyltransferase family protein n=1 Tax=Zhouia spongiae TaxID=2202721 RepID=A0ABY3YJV5_9FLAO|nr:lysophospholipid acyltransferase family protein [Zhouia spongiae]UNY98097.1 lysophospholipid acyltransferase family protein [Zhouia spongiae]
MQLLTYLLVYPLLWMVSKLPFSVFYRVSDFMYLLLYRLIGYRKKVVRSNLRLAFPEKQPEEIKQIEKKFYHHLCDLFMEMIKSLTISKEEMQKRFRFKNIEVLRAFEEQNKSVVLLCGHYASYEWLMSLGYQIRHNGYAVYQPINNKYFDKLVKKIRTKHGAHLISRYETTKTILQKYKAGELALYGLAIDQSPMPSRARYWRKFFGIKVPVFVGAEKIAKSLNSPVIFMDIQKIKRGYYETSFTVISEQPKGLPDYEITDRFTQMLEAQIRKKPEYYLWTHKRFKHKDKAPEGIKA